MLEPRLARQSGKPPPTAAAVILRAIAHWLAWRKPVDIIILMVGAVAIVSMLFHFL